MSEKAREIIEATLDDLFQAGDTLRIRDMAQGLLSALTASGFVVARREEIIERDAELIYLRLYGKDGAKWSANDSKDVWRQKALAAQDGEGT